MTAATMHSASPPTVVVVNDRAFPGGGASKVAVTSAVGLARRGWRVLFFAAMGPASPELLDAGVEVHLLDQPDLASASNRAAVALQAVWNRKAESGLNALLTELKPGKALIHIHSWSKALSPSVFAAAKASELPVLATLHDYGFVCPNAALHDFPLGHACVLKPMSMACISRNCDSRKYVHKLWRVARQYSLEHMAHAHDALHTAVCVSDYSREVYAAHLPSRLKTVVVANPIDVRDLGPANPAGSGTFVYAGRLSREKGVLLLAEAAKLAAVHLKVIGDGELADAMRGINPDIEISGWVSHDRVEQELRGARALVLPALWRETQGMVVPEAMASGLPCIVSSDTAPAAAVEDGITGRIFRNGDKESLAGIFKELTDDDEAIGRMGRAAYDRYWARPLTLDAHLDALENLYGSTVRA